MDPQFHHVEIELGHGKSIRDELIILSSGWAFIWDNIDKRDISCLNLQFNTYSVILSIRSIIVGPIRSLVVITSIRCGVRARGFWGIWLIMEINMFGFMGILSSSKIIEETRCIKYFLVQSVRSIVMFGAIARSQVNRSYGLLLILYSSIIIKLGMAPFHWWFVETVPLIGSVNFIIVCTAQKILPFILLSGLYRRVAVRIFVVIGAFIGLVGRVNLLGIKKLLSYSSVFNGAWILILCYTPVVFTVYLFVYSVSLIAAFMPVRFSVLSNSTAFVGGNQGWVYAVVAGLLRLGGVPPLLGFLGKLVAIGWMLETQRYTVLTILVVSSVLLLYAYLRFRYRLVVVYEQIARGWRKFITPLAVTLLILPALPIIGLLRKGVCTGNFGFPGLIKFKYVSTVV